MTACATCGRITTTTPYGEGLADLCAQCWPTQPDCGQRPHAWRGTKHPGTWRCTACTALLTSQRLSTGGQGAGLRNLDASLG